MLSALRRGTVKVGDRIWEFHGDDANTKLFYITPVPQFVMQDDLPAIQIVQYKTSGSDNGSGYCQLQVELSVPDDVIPGITAEINTLFNVPDPIYQTLSVQAGTLVTLTYPDGQGGTTGMQVDGTDFGSNTAILQVPLDVSQMKEVKTTMLGKGGSPFQIEYALCVPSNMPGVTAKLSFDATIAYKYEVTSHAHKKWAHSTTYTYDISQQLSQSEASSITLTKVDPNLPEEVVDDVRNWAEEVIEAQVAAEVAKALAVRESGSGTKPFSISEVSSFNQSYEQDETVMWRIRPQCTLKSFGDMGLTVDQINQLEVIVDKRRFVVHILPNVSFVNSSSLNSTIKPGDNLSMDVAKLKSLDVTVIYPSLKESAQKTFSFINNEAHTWEGDWDSTAQGVFSINYVAVYEDGKQVKGSKKNIDVSQYTLGLEAIGCLNVTFNATKFFTNAEDNVVESLDVDLVFNSTTEKTPYLQKLTLDNKNPIKTIRSQFTEPITSGYDYTLTYIFTPGTHANPYTTDMKQSNTQLVSVLQPTFVQSIPILVNMGSEDQADFIEFKVNFYYDDEPYFPAIPASKALPKPTASSPVQFEETSTGMVREQLLVFANSKISPLTLSASAVTADMQQLAWGPIEFNPEVATILLFAKATTFTFVEIDPSIVDWKLQTPESKLTAVKVVVKCIYYITDNTNTTRNMGNITYPITWDPERKTAASARVLIPNLPSDYTELSFDWQADYVYTDGVKSVTGKGGSTSATLPKTAF